MMSRAPGSIPPSRLVVLVVAAVLVAGIAWVFGLDVWHAIGIGGAILAVGLAVLAIPDGGEYRWERRESAPRVGARREVVQLSWLLRGQRGVIPDGGQRRARDIARRRLARLGLDLDDPDDSPAIERLLGRSPLEVLRSYNPRRASPTTLARSLDALDRLGTADLERPAPTADPDRPPAGPNPLGHDRTSRKKTR